MPNHRVVTTKAQFVQIGALYSADLYKSALQLLRIVHTVTGQKKTDVYVCTWSAAERFLVARGLAKSASGFPD
jgi:hypothetical protein